MTATAFAGEEKVRLLTLANHLLPSPSPDNGIRAHSGWQSVSKYVPSAVTRLADRATVENNELPDASTS